MSKKILVAGAGGFIGGHLVEYLRGKGFDDIRAVDRKPREDWYQVHDYSEHLVLDLQLRDNCYAAMKDVDVVYNLAADMGGMGFIENNKALCMISAF